MDDAAPLPVTVITGFLGSGKTTLLSRLLRHPDMGRTAVIINEFGEVGLDHELVASSNDENMVLMDSGCICCSIRSDLADTMKDLFIKRADGRVPPFERVLIETTGLADPAPILHTLMVDPLIGSRFRLDGVVTTVDAVNGGDQLDRHVESLKQAAVADRLLLTKSDLARDPATRNDVERLRARLHRLNPGAPLHEVPQGEIDPALLFDCGLYDPDSKAPDVARWLREEAYRAEHDEHDHEGHTHHEHGHHDHGHHDHRHHDHRHDAGIRSFCIRRDGALSWDTWVGWLEALISTRGNDILRMKGLLAVEGLDAPVAVHGVQHLFHPPAVLDAWPSDDHGSRIVFIVQNLGEDAVRKMLEAWAGTPPDAAYTGR